jgi:tetratricopeptide (TPR) repeat protein
MKASSSQILRTRLSRILLALAGVLCAGWVAASESPSQGLDDPGAVFERVRSSYRFEADGTGVSVFEVRARPLSAAGVQQLGQVVIPYLKSRSSVELLYFRVRKPGGEVLEVDSSKIQDLPAPVAAAFPIYSDLHLFHVQAPALNSGDILEYAISVTLDRPDTPGNFSAAHVFGRLAPITTEILEIDIPATVDVKLRSGDGLEPAIVEEDDRRVYRWEQASAAIRTEEIDLPDVELSSFSSWDELGNWYLELSSERATPDDRIRELAQEITRGATSDLERVEAIYHHVARGYRYLGLVLGIARYQPQAASDVLANGYGDCKDKHTLLQALAKAVGFEAHPVLVSTSREITSSVPALHQFNHMISLVIAGDEWVWLDATSQVTPFRYLNRSLRDKQAFVVGLNGVSRLERTPDALPFEVSEELVFDGEITGEGDLVGEIQYRARSDGEFGLRSLLFANGTAAREKIADEFVRVSLGGGFEVEEFSTSPLTDTDGPLVLSFKVRQPGYANLLRETQKLDHYLMPQPLPKVDKDEPSLDLGEPSTVRSEFRVRLPDGFEVQAPAGSAMTTEFASYVTEYSAENRLLSAKRTMRILSPDIGREEYRAYDAFRSTLRADDGQHFRLRQSDEARLARTADADVEQLFDAGKRALRGEDSEGGIAILSRVVELEPEHAEAWLHLGKALVGVDRVEEGVEALRKQMQIDPYANNASGTLGWALEEAGDLRGAEAAYRRQIELYPLEHYAHAQLGRILEDQDRCEEGLDHLEKAVSLQESDTRSKMALGICLLALDQPERARPSLLDLLKASQSGWELGRAGHRALRADLFELADKLLTRATELDPEHGSAFNNLGLIRLEQDRLEEAVAAFRRQIAVEPDDIHAHNNLGRALRRQGKPALAVASFRRQITINPEDRWAHRNLGLALEDLGDLEGAFEAYERHLEIDPLDVDTLKDISRLGRVSDEAYGRFLAQARSALADEGVDEEIQALEAMLLARSGRCDEAVPMLEKIVERHPQSSADLKTLTLCHYQLLNSDEALTSGLKAFALVPEDPQVNSVLGLLYSHKGDYPAALRHLEAAAKNVTGPFEFQDVLDYLRGREEN